MGTSSQPCTLITLGASKLRRFLTSDLGARQCASDILPTPLMNTTPAIPMAYNEKLTRF